MRIAILLTCFNRKKLTLDCLKFLEKSLHKEEVDSSLSIYLTDDGSTDGTSQAVSESFPNVKILKGDGDLYWAGGMRNSWREALKGNYDGYILLNDDTFVFENVVVEIKQGIDYCFDNYNKNGIIIGSTKDQSSNDFTYGGSVFINKFMGTYTKLIPNGSFQDCQLGNGNIMFVHKDVVNEIGILGEEYIHGVADFDYTLNASKCNIPILVLPHYSGYCSANTENKNKYFLNLKSIKKRYNYLMSPTGLALKDNLCFQKKYFPMRFYFVLIIAYFKVLFPHLYLWVNNSLRK